MRRRISRGSWFALLVAMPYFVAADEKSESEFLEPHLGEQVLAVARVDLATVSAKHLALPLAALQSFPNSGLSGPFSLASPSSGGGANAVVVPQDELIGLVGLARKLHETGAKHAYLLLAPMASRQEIVLACAIPVAEDRVPSVEKLVSALPGQKQVRRIPGGLLIGGAIGLDRATQHAANSGREVSAALAAAGDAPLAVLVIPSRDQRRVLREIGPLVASPETREMLTPALQNLDWATIVFGEQPSAFVRVVADYGSEVNADAAKGSFATIKRLLSADKLVQTLQVNVRQSQVHLELSGPEFESISKEMTSHAGRGQATNSLKQLALAMHNELNSHKEAHFIDAASRDAEGRPLLSWRVHLLPYLEQHELYQQFHLDEPWDSEHNKQLIGRMPLQYQIGSPEVIRAGKTCAVLLIGERTMFPNGRGLAVKAIVDGLSNTLMIVEADDDHAVVWTKPDDLIVDESQPKRGLGQHYGKGFLAAHADGSVQFHPASTSDATIRALLTATAKDVVEPNP